ncbi:MAG: ATP-binding cassette domain-containing protein [Deltaproteobacteria bacterium]|nr:ATP-binding cassette domain-containing protein [Deltaproteobacteria bacterium]
MLEIKDLKKDFYQGWLKRPSFKLGNINFSVRRGQALGLLGPSGSGKSTIARIILRLIPANEGRVIYDGLNLLSLSKKNFRPYRKKMQIIFQQPNLALDPKKTIINTLR